MGYISEQQNLCFRETYIPAVEDNQYTHKKNTIVCLWYVPGGKKRKIKRQNERNVIEDGCNCSQVERGDATRRITPKQAHERRE